MNVAPLPGFCSKFCKECPKNENRPNSTLFSEMHLINKQIKKFVLFCNNFLHANFSAANQSSEDIDLFSV